MRRFLAVVLFAVAGLAQTRGRVADYALILEDAPAAQAGLSRADLFGARMGPRFDRIRAAQSGVLAELARRKIAVRGTSQVLLNAVFVRVDRATAVGLRAVPGVSRVVYCPPLKPDLNAAVNLVNAAPAWAALGGAGNAGAGVKIAVIDSGIDQNHAAFQDASLKPPSGFPKGDAGFTNGKVIVARSFVEQLPFPDPDSRNTRPDDLTPRDHVGHGTAIAMIAAGAQNTGPLAAIQGIAPKAFLGNYKVQGSPGVNDYATTPAVIAALTAALQDGMDIATLAYGEGDMPDVGPLDVDKQACTSDPNGVCDPIAQAVESAIKSGMAVVTAAGNDGSLGPKFPTLNTIHTPGTAPSGITVGASTNSHALYQSVTPGGSGAPGAMAALEGDGPQLQTALSAPLKDVTQLGNDGLACVSLQAGSLAGAIALIQRGTCAFSDKITNAQNAGAVGVVVYQSIAGAAPYREWGATDTGIPAMMIGNADGLALKAWADATPSATAALNPVWTASNSTANVVADFSSRGPAIGTLGIKPELVAPGVSIYTATQKIDPNSPMYHPSGYTSASGTSMAVGFVAGAAALVKQKNPSFTPGQIKSALVNTATQDVVEDDGSQARITSVGAGKLNALNAVNAGVAFEPAAMAFGAIGAASLPINQTLTITNGGSSPVALTLAVQPNAADSRASVSLSQSSLNLSPNQRTSITVTLQGSQPNPGSYDGFIVATAGSVTYRIPYLYLVSDGVMDSAFPIADGGFIGAAGDTGWFIELKAIDRFGLPILGAPVVWSVLSGGGQVTNADSQTYNNGVAAALVNLGSTAGDQTFRATINSTYNVDFFGFARPYQTVSAGGIADATGNTALTGLAPGSYISLYGSNLAPTFQAVSTPALPYSLSQVSVGFYAANGRFPGRIHFVSPGQVNVQVPWELDGQTTAKLVVRIGDTPSDAYDVPLARYAPGIFQYNDNGRLSAAVLDYPANKVVAQANPAVRGNVIQLFVNGLGPVDNRPPSGEQTPYPPLVTTLATPTVTIGGKNAPVGFSGMAPFIVGLYQINVTVPPDAPTGVQPLIVTINGIPSQTANLPVK